jgi:micrococcal nuclease
MFEYQAKILHVIDGDTLRLDLDLGFYVRIEQIARLARINTPETVKWTTAGLRDPAKDYILSNCPIGSTCIARISRQEKYGRWLAEVLFLPGEVDRAKILRNPRNLNDELVRNGLAQPYSGGKK